MVSICCSSFIYYTVLQGGILNSFCCIHCQFFSVLYSIPCYKKLEINTVFSRRNASLSEEGGQGVVNPLAEVEGNRWPGYKA